MTIIRIKEINYNDNILRPLRSRGVGGGGTRGHRRCATLLHVGLGICFASESCPRRWAIHMLPVETTEGLLASPSQGFQKKKGLPATISCETSVKNGR